MAVLNALQRTSRRGKRTRIGLDIGSSGVRAVQLTRAVDGYVVTNAACGGRSPSEPGAQATGQNEDRSPKIEEADGLGLRSLIFDLRSLGLNVGFRGKSVAVALAPPDVEFHTLELPAAVFQADGAEGQTSRPRREGLEQIVRFEVERLMTQQAARVETRHWRLPQTSVPAPNAIGAGAAHEIINATIEICAKAGLTCSELDTTATALGRFGAMLQSRPQDQVWGVLDVGDRQTRLVLCLDDTPVLVRTAGAGGRAWTQRIADALQLSFKAAEIHKRDHGIALTGRALALVRERILAPAVLSPAVESTLLPAADEGTRSELASLILGAVRADLNDLASEVKRSYEYVLSCYPGRQAGDLVLCGGGSLLHHLPEFLGNALGIPVRRASSYLQDSHDAPVWTLPDAPALVASSDPRSARPTLASCPPWSPGACRLRYAAEGNAPLEVLAVAVGLAISEPGAGATGPHRATKPRSHEATKNKETKGTERQFIRHSTFDIRHSVNFIPESVQAAQARGRHIKRWAACLAVTTAAAVVPVGAHWMQHVRLDELRAQSDKLQIDLAAARTELKSATAASNDAFVRIERAKALRTKRAWSDMLALIGSCLPKDCRLTSIATDPDVPSAAPPARKAPPATDPTPSPHAQGGQRGSTADAEKPAVVIIDAPRKLRMTGEATDAAQPLFFVTRLKESQVFKEVTLERSINTSPHGSRAVGLTREKSNPGAGADESNYRFELICEW